MGTFKSLGFCLLWLVLLPTELQPSSRLLTARGAYNIANLPEGQYSVCRWLWMGWYTAFKAHRRV